MGPRLGVILGLALLLRLTLFLVVCADDDRRVTIDSREYAAVAADLGGSYGNPATPGFAHGLKRGPSYPLFLAMAGRVSAPPWRLIAALQIGFDLISIALLWLLARRLLGATAAPWAALALAVDPITIMYSQYILTESCFTMLLLSATALVVGHDGRRREGRLWLFAGAGLVLGVALLLRPIATYLPLVVAPAWWYFSTLPWRRRLVTLVVFLLSFAALPFGFRAWREAVSGIPLVSTVEAENLLLYQAANVAARAQGRRVEAVRAELQEELGITHGWGADPIVTTRAAKARALAILLAHPVATATSLGAGSLLILFGPGVSGLATLLGLADLPLIVTLALLGELALLYVLAIAGVRRLARAQRWALLTTIGVTLTYLTLAAAGYGAYSRFRVPLVPFLALLVGAGVDLNRRVRPAAEYARRAAPIGPGSLP